MKVTMIWNEKGGVAKSITSLQLASGIAQYGKKTLLIDGDPQGSLTNLIFDFEKIKEIDEEQTTTSSVLINPKEIKRCIHETNIDNLFVIPETGELNRTIKLLERDSLTSNPNKLQLALEVIKDEFEEVIIDNNPMFSWFVYNAIVVSNQLIIPTNLEFNSLRSVNNSLHDVLGVLDRLYIDNGIDFKVLVVKHQNKSVTENQRFNQLKAEYKQHLFKQTIREQDITVKNYSYNHKVIVLEENNNNGVTVDYRRFVDEYMNNTFLQDKYKDNVARIKKNIVIKQNQKMKSAKSLILNANCLPIETKYEYVSNIDTSKLGTTTIKVNVVVNDEVQTLTTTLIVE